MKAGKACGKCFSVGEKVGREQNERDFQREVSGEVEKSQNSEAIGIETLYSCNSCFVSICLARLLRRQTRLSSLPLPCPVMQMRVMPESDW